MYMNLYAHTHIHTHTHTHIQKSVINTGHTRNIFGVAFLPGTRDLYLATGAMDHQVCVRMWGRGGWDGEGGGGEHE